MFFIIKRSFSGSILVFIQKQEGSNLLHSKSIDKIKYKQKILKENEMFVEFNQEQEI